MSQPLQNEFSTSAASRHIERSDALFIKRAKTRIYAIVVRLKAHNIRCFAARKAVIYELSRFNDAGYKQWLFLLKEAAKEQNEHWLAYQLEAKGLMKGFEGAMTPSGGYIVKHTPNTAAETMAEGQFRNV